MTVATLIAFNLTLLASMASPGPALLLALKTTLTSGRMAGIVTGLGLGTMAAIWTGLALLGLEGVFKLFPWAYVALKTGGALYLLYIAYGMFKDADKPLIRMLKEAGILLMQEQYLHEYPFCWRASEDPLIQYPRRSWFIKTTKFRDLMLKNNSQIGWQPEHIRDGRFGNFLEANVPSITI